MNTHVHHHPVDFGSVSIGNPLLWLAAVVLGFVLVGQWPDFFAGAGEAQAQPAVSAVTATPAAYVSSDPSLPSAGEVFAGRPYEPVQYVETF